ncbi:hypothetical protein KXX06_004974, partial [Aspergillus fumigatus]
MTRRRLPYISSRSSGPARPTYAALGPSPVKFKYNDRHVVKKNLHGRQIQGQPALRALLWYRSGYKVLSARVHIRNLRQVCTAG